MVWHSHVLGCRAVVDNVGASCSWSSEPRVLGSTGASMNQLIVVRRLLERHVDCLVLMSKHKPSKYCVGPAKQGWLTADPCTHPVTRRSGKAVRAASFMCAFCAAELHIQIYVEACRGACGCLNV